MSLQSINKLEKTKMILTMNLRMTLISKQIVSFMVFLPKIKMTKSNKPRLKATALKNNPLNLKLKHRTKKLKRKKLHQILNSVED